MIRPTKGNLTLRLEKDVIRKAKLLAAARISERHRVAFWDGLIVAATAQGGARTLVSEDFQDGALIGGVRVRNPFVANGGKRRM